MSKLTADTKRPATGEAEAPWWALIIWVPAALALAWCVWLRVGIPEPADWVFVRHESALPLRWGEIFEVQHGSLFLAFRCLYVGILTIPRFGLEFGTLMPWLFALATWWVARRVLRMLARSTAHPSLWIADLVLGLWIFHPAWGLNWLLAGRVREFLPIMAFGLALLSLDQRKPWHTRWCGALFWVLIAQASHVTGLIAWLAIGPAVYGAAQSQGFPKPWRSMWLLLGWSALAQLFIWQGFRMAAPAPGIMSYLSEDPRSVTSFVYQLTVAALPTPVSGFEWEQGTTCWAASLGLVAVALIRRKRLDARGGSLVSLTLYGAMVLLVVTDMAYRGQPGMGAQPLEFARESAIGGFAMLLGAYGLFREWMPRVFGALHVLFLGALLAIFARDWYFGFEHLEMSRGLLRSQATELVWEEVMPGAGIGREPPPYSNLRASLLAPDDLQDLRDRGLLGHLPVLPGADLGDDYPLPDLAYCGEFHGIVGTEVQSVLSGTLSQPVPGLVLVARKRGKELRVLTVMRPKYDQGFDQVVAIGVAPSPDLVQLGDRVQAFGLELSPLDLRPLRGEFEVRESGLVRLESPGK